MNNNQNKVDNCEPKSDGCKPSVLSDLLYGIVQWINSHPILDGMKYFATKEQALIYAEKMSSGKVPAGVTVNYTIIRLEQAI